MAHFSPCSFAFQYHEGTGETSPLRRQAQQPAWDGQHTTIFVGKKVILYIFVLFITESFICSYLFYLFWLIDATFFCGSVLIFGDGDAKSFSSHTHLMKCWPVNCHEQIRLPARIWGTGPNSETYPHLFTQSIGKETSKG